VKNSVFCKYAARFAVLVTLCVAILGSATVAYAQPLSGDDAEANKINNEEIYAQLNLYNFLDGNSFDESYKASYLPSKYRNYSSVKELAKAVAGSETDEYKVAKLFANFVTNNLSVPNNVSSCMNYSYLFRTMCNSYNIPCVMISGFAYDEYANGVAHAWNAFYAGGKWHYVDCGALVTGDTRYWDMTVDFMSTHREASAIYWGSVISYNSSSWSKDTIDLAVKNNLINYAFYNSHNHKSVSTYTLLSPNVSYLQNRCNRESFAILAINLLEEYYGIEHYESSEDAYGQGTSEYATITTNDGIDELLALKGVSMPPASTFSDTDSRYVRAAYALGIISGYGNGKFGPTDTLTRQQAAKILGNVAAIMGITVPDDQITAAVAGFTDADQLSSWAVSGVGTVKALGVMNGTTDTTFSPEDSYTGEQCIVTIERLYEYAIRHK
jgi:hypothetical protein